MLEDWKHGGFGLYLHWPYCESKCPYCDFNSHVVEAIDHERWQAAYLSEIERAGAITPDRVLNSVFFGGGTPSLMKPDVVNAILEKIRETWRIANDVEITLEANPSSVETNRFAGFADAGVNRVSLGIQALSDEALVQLGRLHSLSDAHRALDIAKDTFGELSFDLIYARQNQSLTSWKGELSRALELAGNHLSLYQLTIEPGTAFGRRFSKGGLAGLPSEDLSADMYELTGQVCADAGLLGYEISNYARLGHEGRHNSIYWESGDYIGIGPGAHGRLTVNGGRHATETELNPLKWLLSVEREGSGESLSEKLSVEDQVSEMVLMGLRLSRGIRKSRIEPLVSDAFWDRCEQLEEDGLVIPDPTALRLSEAGRPVLNGVAAQLLRDH